MEQSILKAQDTFKYFWRELSWDYRRIVPALELAIVKAAFTQKINTIDEPIVEYMWIDQIDFDGDIISGVLMNAPYELTNIKQGDSVQLLLTEIIDWLSVCDGEAYGGFTVQKLRSQMDDDARQKHDDTWGIHFGSYDDISIVLAQKTHPENLLEHPMSINMQESLRTCLHSEQRDAMLAVDDQGYNLLHREAIAGNASIVKLLLEEGMDPLAKTQAGKTALDYATQLGWAHIVMLFPSS